MFKARHAVRQAVRTVVEELEDRRLLASASIGLPDVLGKSQIVPVTLTGGTPPALSADHFALQNSSDSATDETPAKAVTTAGNTATFTLSQPGDPIASGWYGAYVRHDALDPAEVHANFAFLAGDLDNDGGVRINDFNTFSSHYGQSGPGITYAEGDVCYNGSVDINDYNLLVANFGRTLPAAPDQAGDFEVSNLVEGQLDLMWELLNGGTVEGFHI